MNPKLFKLIYYTFLYPRTVEALLKERYPQIAERIILMALESVNYAEDRATQILQIVQDEDEQRSKKHTMIKTMSRESCKQLPTAEVDGAAPIR